VEELELELSLHATIIKLANNIITGLETKDFTVDIINLT